MSIVILPAEWLAEQNFDAWGRYHNPATWVYDGSYDTRPDWLIRGFTGHEHLRAFALIHMNARLYTRQVADKNLPGAVAYPDISPGWSAGPKVHGRHVGVKNPASRLPESRCLTHNLICRYFDNHYLCSPELEALHAYTLRFSGLSLGFHSFVYEVDASFFGRFPGSLITEGALKVAVEVEKKTSSLVLQFGINGQIELPCDRCMQPVRLPVESKAQLVIRLSGQPEENDDDLIWLPMTAYEYNLASYIYENIHLNVPLQVSCAMGPDKGCRADAEALLSKYSGEATGSAEEEGTDGPVDPRWEKLKNLKF